MTAPTYTLPIVVRSLRLEVPRQRQRIEAAHKGRVRLTLNGSVHGKLPARVTLERIAPDKLPERACEDALQYVRRGVAACLGVEDGDDRVTWVYRQRKPEEGERGLVRMVVHTKAGGEVRRYGVRIRIAQERA